MEDIYAFGLRSVRAKWRATGYPLEEMPPGVFPVDPALPPEEIAQRQIKLLEAGVMGEPNGRPDSSPEVQRDLLRHRRPLGRHGAPSTAGRDGPVAVRRRRALARRRRERLDPGRARRGARARRHPRDELGRLDRRLEGRRSTRGGRCCAGASRLRGGPPRTCCASAGVSRAAARAEPRPAQSSAPSRNRATSQAARRSTASRSSVGSRELLDGRRRRRRRTGRRARPPPRSAA